jgi:hypothetical protein
MKGETVTEYICTIQKGGVVGEGDDLHEVDGAAGEVNGRWERTVCFGSEEKW